MHGITLIQDLAIVMAVAAVITLLCHRIHIPVVLGYILAGLIIGPHTPPYSLITDVHSIETLSELGVVFLLFAIGLEFSLSRLMKVGLVAFIAATLEILLMMTIGYFLGRAFGWSFMDSLFLGAILSISSTTIIAKVLMETKKINEKFAQVILGILIIEDLLAILIIAILSGLATSGVIAVDAIFQAALRVAIFTASTLVIGFLVIPRLLRHLEKINIPETLVVSVLGLCFAGALAAVKAGFSVALGAFLMGAIVAETKQIKKVIHQIEPIRDMFTAVFFVAVGMMIKPSVIGEFWFPILIITIVTITGKVFSCSFATFVSGYKPDTALMVGLGLAQIGEFSFIIANLGESTKVTSSYLYPIIVSVSAITTLTTPFLMRSSSHIIEFLKKIIPERLETFLGLYTSWIHSFGQNGKSKHGWKQLLGASKIHAGIEKIISDIIDPGTVGKTAHDDLVKFIRDEYPWEVETADYLVPFNESALNQKLSDLRLRSATGASIMAIYRDELSIPNPSADVKLVSGDVLLILGDKEQIKSAIEFLQKKAKEPLPIGPQKEGVPPKTQPFQVGPGLVCVGKTIEEVRLKRKSGATILGIQKGDQVMHNPGKETVIEEGDMLMLFGLPDQLEAACAYLSSK